MNPSREKSVKTSLFDHASVSHPAPSRPCVCVCIICSHTDPSPSPHTSSCRLRSLLRPRQKSSRFVRDKRTRRLFFVFPSNACAARAPRFLSHPFLPPSARPARPRYRALFKPRGVRAPTHYTHTPNRLEGFSDDHLRSLCKNLTKVSQTSLIPFALTAHLRGGGEGDQQRPVHAQGEARADPAGGGAPR
jgi:hypothetical protein